MNKILSRICVIAIVCHSGLHAAIINIPMGGTTSTDEWTSSGLTSASNPGFPGFPGSGAWPSGILANVGGGSTLVKTANGSGGGPFPAGSGLYFGGFSFEPNLNGGSLAVQDTSPLLGVQTIVFQIVIGEALGWDFFNSALPTLSVNGGAALNANYSSLFDQQPNGEFTIEGETFDLYLNTYALQWDVRDYDVSSFQIDFTGVQHATISGLRVDQSTMAYDFSVLPAPIPEPSTWLLLGISTLAVVCLRLRSNRKRNPIVSLAH